MPQIAADDAAHDEPKTYNDEKGLDGWEQDSLELENVKGDLVQQGDPEQPQDQAYDNKASGSHGTDGGQRRKSESERADSVGGATNGRLGSATVHGLAYSSADINSLMPNFPQSSLQSFLSPVMPTVSASYPYPSPYHQHLPLQFYGAASAADLEAKAAGMARAGDISSTAMYSLPGQLGQIPHPLSSWSVSPAAYPAFCTAASMAAGILRPSYPFALTSAATGIPHFPMLTPQNTGLHPSMLPHPTSLQLPGQLSNGHQPGPSKASNDNKMLHEGASNSMHHHHHHHPNHLGLVSHNGGSKRKESKNEKPDRPYVKKPLNAFMLYMKEQRAKVVAECTLKESAAINQILGRKWHNLNRDEQQKYYDMARKERQIHMEKFPGWSARDNYGKRKKRKKEKTQDCTAQNPKKCRAVFGLEQQQKWCPPCRRKKKCVRYKTDGGDDSDLDDSDDSPINFYQGSPGMMQQGGGMYGSHDVGCSSNSSLHATGSNGNNSGGPSPCNNHSPPIPPPPHRSDNPQIKRERSPHDDHDSGVHGISSDNNNKQGMFHNGSNGNNNNNNNNSNNNIFPPQQQHIQQQRQSPSSSNSNAGASGNSKRSSEASPTGSTSGGGSNPFSHVHPTSESTRLPHDHVIIPSSRAGSSSSSSVGGSRRSTLEHPPTAHIPMTSSYGIGAANIFNPNMLSPGNLGNPHTPFFTPFPPYANLNAFAAAANLQSSPAALSGLMGFSGLKGFASPMGLGLNHGANSPAGSSANMPGSATSSRLTSSALEGKS